MFEDSVGDVGRLGECPREKGDGLFFRFFQDRTHRSDHNGAGSFGCQVDSGGHLVKFLWFLSESRGWLFLCFLRLFWFWIVVVIERVNRFAGECKSLRTMAMARAARHKSSEAAFYHLTNRVTGWTDWFPFEKRQARRKFLNMMLFYVNIYRCRLAAFQIMGNHFHFIVHFEKPRPLSREELRESAHKLYGRKAEVTTARWTDAQWAAFNQRLFDVSKLMANLDGQYAMWFNRKFARRGHFWGDRFQEPGAPGTPSRPGCHPLRGTQCRPGRTGQKARAVEVGSARWRLTGKDQDLIPLEELFPSDPGTDLYSSYRLACTIEEPSPPGRTRPRSQAGSSIRSSDVDLSVLEFSPAFAISDGRIGRRAGREGGAAADDLSAARSISTSPTPSLNWAECCFPCGSSARTRLSRRLA